jgi:hypothetical protein
MADLAAMQQAFLAIVVGAAPPGAADGLVDAGRTDVATRMRVYAHAYVERIGAALASDFPKLQAVLGHERFAALVRAYLRACPPRHWTLRDAGDRLADFLATDETWEPWLAELARLERARVEAFDAADAPVAARQELAGVPPEGFLELRLALVPSAQLVGLRHAADQVWSDVEDGAPWSPPTASVRPVMVWRRGLTVVHRTLADDEARFLATLAGGGRLADACEAMAAHPDPVARALEVLLDALDGGLFRGGAL